MIYDHILVRFGELALRGKNRSSFEKQLLQNIRSSISEFKEVKVKRTFGRIIVQLNDQPHEPIMEKLKGIFGIHSFSLALKVENELKAMQEGALRVLSEHQQKTKTFKISARRAYKSFPVSSQELNHKIGGYVLSQTENVKVDVHHPDLNIRVEVREHGTYITAGSYPGVGGLPVGTSGKVLMMLSGGIDSPVAGYLAMKRGAKLEAIHFHSPPFTNERAKQKVLDLARVLTKYGGDITVHLVPFTDVQKHIRAEVPSNFQMTIMRRMMLRISEQIANQEQILAIATGESLGQVASQTLHSIHTINEVTNLPVLRPLITMDKLEVMDIAKEIGSYEISILPYEDCCTIFLPADPKTKPRRDQAHKFEQYVDIDFYVDDAVKRTEKIVISEKTNHKEYQSLF
ncbi:tRNA uracil 4-sulfurtransferase ThiI [Bacillus sp. JCM 19034]|uniref:tRNA uracil 4-sulfurtransferase ThiI n=1 Tax=Bacillus sp. JCM 19034 TaxID=1481928 RepID=UPI000783BB58|nr:tRNA uracil 4-sulfurtransferase ThiI [Bacillus sp. JCM 19034]